MDAAAIFERLQARFGDAVVTFDSGGEPAVRVNPSAIFQVCVGGVLVFLTGILIGSS